MEKEIFDQPGSTERTLRGRVDFDNYKGNIYLHLYMYVDSYVT